MATWEKGKSGNPNGRPVVVPQRRASAIVQSLLEGDCEVMTRTVIELARKGDPTALKIVFDRIAPPRKSLPISFPFPRIDEDARMPEAIMKAVIKCVGSGEVTPTEAQEVVALVKTYMEAKQHSEVMSELEQMRRELDMLRGVKTLPAPSTACEEWNNL